MGAPVAADEDQQRAVRVLGLVPAGGADLLFHLRVRHQDEAPVLDVERGGAEDHGLHQAGDLGLGHLVCWVELLDGAAGGDGFDLSSLQFCLTGGAPMPVEVMSDFEKRFPVKILEGFGLSETSPVASFNMLDRPRKVGSIGYPVWGVEMCIMDDTGNQLPDGERGEICIRGEIVMQEYWRKPDATAETIDPDGWLHSGDVGYISEDGYLQITDRMKDMFIVGGFNAYPAEIENTLLQMPGVGEVAVIGVPDERLAGDAVLDGVMVAALAIAVCP